MKRSIFIALLFAGSILGGCSDATINPHTKTSELGEKNRKLLAAHAWVADVGEKPLAPIDLGFHFFSTGLVCTKNHVGMLSDNSWALNQSGELLLISKQYSNVVDTLKIIDANETELLLQYTASGETWKYLKADNIGWGGIYSTPIAKANVATTISADGSKVLTAGPNFVILSEDRGVTWRQLDILDTQDAYPPLKVAVSGDELFCSYESGTFSYSHDNGDSWMIVQLPDSVRLLTFAVHKNFVALACTDESGSFVAKVSRQDFSATVKNNRQLTFGTRHYVAQQNSIKQIFLGEGGVAALQTTRNNIEISQDDGETWRQISQSLGYIAMKGNTFVGISNNSDVLFSNDFGNSWQIALTPEAMPSSVVYAGNSVFVCGGRVHRSTDRGKTWTQFEEGLPESNFVAGLAMAASGNYVYMSRDSNGEFLFRSQFADIER